ncbi:ABC transporter ATP-binding protein [Leptolyngbya sp. BC1307]|uniref:ABC transporter ATP-binding protein n=1 Tax=Leptolyngbya sp. BC1307 TaxID=2029589 RepID=UPI000EFAEDDD|nr:ABC transporter ATP-binding protein [Leptolyngbya sp. BC1307]
MSKSGRVYNKFLVTYLSPQRGRVAGIAIALFASIGLQVLNPQILRYFIDTAVAGGPQRLLVQAALGFMAIALIRQSLAVAATYFSETVAWSATNNLRLDLVQHCLQLDLAFHKAHTPGELVEKVDGDVDALSRFFSQFVLQVVGNGLLVAGVLGVLWWEDWRAGLALSLFAVIALGILSRLQALAVGPWRLYRQISAEFYGFVGEYLSGLEDIRANGATGYVMDRFYRILRQWLKAFHRARLTSTLLWGTTVGLFSVGTAIALALGAYLWSRNAITIGTVYLLYYYATLLEEPIEKIREELEQFQQATASFQRIQDLLQQQSHLHPAGRAVLPQGALDVKFEAVCFGYDAAPTLENVTFDLPAGQTLGLLGRTGSGKSTLARLLLRLYDIQHGEICLGGINVAEVPLSILPHRIGLVTQDVQLFQTTVRNNLTFFNPRILDEQILKTLADLGLMPWLERLPQGLDTQLGADSSGLSAGQAQLLAFARVFLKDPGLVILDEASSRLDPTTEALIERAVDRLLGKRTGIIIAHRLETVRRADQILILEQGRVVEYGDRIGLACDARSNFSRLLQAGTVQKV